MGPKDGDPRASREVTFLQFYLAKYLRSTWNLAHNPLFHFPGCREWLVEAYYVGELPSRFWCQLCPEKLVGLVSVLSAPENR
jgi:hypothetical protein